METAITIIMGFVIGINFIAAILIIGNGIKQKFNLSAIFLLISMLIIVLFEVYSFIYGSDIIKDKTGYNFAWMLSREEMILLLLIPTISFFIHSFLKYRLYIIQVLISVIFPGLFICCMFLDEEGYQQIMNHSAIYLNPVAGFYLLGLIMYRLADKKEGSGILAIGYISGLILMIIHFLVEIVDAMPFPTGDIGITLLTAFSFIAILKYPSDESIPAPEKDAPARKKVENPASGKGIPDSSENKPSDKKDNDKKKVKVKAEKSREKIADKDCFDVSSYNVSKNITDQMKYINMDMMGNAMMNPSLSFGDYFNITGRYLRNNNYISFATDFFCMQDNKYLVAQAEIDGNRDLFIPVILLIKSEIKLICKNTLEIEEITYRLNNQIINRFKNTTIRVKAFLIIFDLDENFAEYINADYASPVIYNSDINTASLIEGRQPPLGENISTRYHKQNINLSENMKIFILSQEIFELFKSSDKETIPAIFEELVSRTVNLNTEQTADTIYERIKELSEPSRCHKEMCFLAADLKHFLPPHMWSKSKKDRFLDKLFRDAWFFMEEEDYHDALIAFNDIIDLDQYNHMAYYNMGLVHLKVGEYSNARLKFEKATILNPRFAESFYNMGIASFNLYDFDGAITAWEKVKKLNPDHHQIDEQIAAAHSKKQEIEV